MSLVFITPLNTSSRDAHASCYQCKGFDNFLSHLKKIDTEKEEILLAKSEAELSVESLPANVPTDEARYHFFLFKHTHEGDYLESVGESNFLTI